MKFHMKNPHAFTCKNSTLLNWDYHMCEISIPHVKCKPHVNSHVK